MFLLAAMMLRLTTPDAVYEKRHFEKENHQYYEVVGYCRGEVKYTMHSEDCPCKAGKYEVK